VPSKNRRAVDVPPVTQRFRVAKVAAEAIQGRDGRLFSSARRGRRTAMGAVDTGILGEVFGWYFRFLTGAARWGCLQRRWGMHFVAMSAAGGWGLCES